MHITLMKKTALVILWMVAAYIVGFTIAWLAIKVSWAYFTHQTEAHREPGTFGIDGLQHFWMWLFTLGLPILAMIFGVRGILPGTRGTKQNV